MPFSFRNTAALATLLLALWPAGCVMSRSSPNRDFSKVTEEFVYSSLALSPVSATAAGYHDHHGIQLDEMLDDYSSSGLAEQRSFYQNFRERLNNIKPESHCSSWTPSKATGTTPPSTSS